MTEEIKLKTIERPPVEVFPAGVSRAVNNLITLQEFKTVYKQRETSIDSAIRDTERWLSEVIKENGGQLAFLLLQDYEALSKLAEQLTFLATLKESKFVIEALGDRFKSFRQWQKERGYSGILYSPYSSFNYWYSFIYKSETN